MPYTITRTKPNEGQWIFQTTGDLPAISSPAPKLEHLFDHQGQPFNPELCIGKSVMICTVPSLPTPTCFACFEAFNQQAASLGDNILVLMISNDKIEDLQKGYQQLQNKEGVTLSSNIKILSAFGENCRFGSDYGVQFSGDPRVEQLEESSEAHKSCLNRAKNLVNLGWFARSALVISPEGRVVHTEMVHELTQQPNYAACVAAASKASQEYQASLKTQQESTSAASSASSAASSSTAGFETTPASASQPNARLQDLKRQYDLSTSNQAQEPEIEQQSDPKRPRANAATLLNSSASKGLQKTESSQNSETNTTIEPHTGKKKSKSKL